MSWELTETILFIFLLYVPGSKQSVRRQTFEFLHTWSSWAWIFYAFINMVGEQKVPDKHGHEQWQT